jgi:hypothetical protein
MHAYNQILAQVEAEMEEVVVARVVMPKISRKAATVGNTGVYGRLANKIQQIKNTRRKQMNNKRKAAFSQAATNMQWGVKTGGRRRKTRKAKRNTNKK